MIHEDDIHIGQIIVHTTSDLVYRVEGIGMMKMPSGEWVQAARYRAMPGNAEYYRQLTDFNNFLEVKVK